MKRSVVATFLYLGAFASAALASDFAIKGRLSESIEGSNNYFLSNAPSGATFKTLSAINLDFLARTPTTQYLLDTHYSYYKYFGPGTADLQLTHGTPANANFAIDHVTQLTKYHFGASWSRVDTATALLEQTGVASGSGSTNTYSVNGGLVHDLGRIDTISWSATASTASSSDSSFTPYRDVSSSLVWNHTLGETTTLINSVNFDWFSQDNDANSQRLFWKLLTGGQSRLTRRLSINGNVGLAFVNAYQNGFAPMTAPLLPSGVAPFSPLVGNANSIIWDVGLNYRLLKNTNLSVNAAQAITPTILGQLQKSETLGLSISHEVNRRSNISFFTQLSQSTSGQGGITFSTGQATKSEFFTASIHYGYQLARDWRTNLSYTYNQRNDDSGSVNASTVLVSLSYDFTLLGNPTAINAAQRERARQRAQQSVGYVLPTFR